MEKLKIEHLAAYLPYGLNLEQNTSKWIDAIGKRIVVMNQLSLSSVEQSDYYIGYSFENTNGSFESINFKPILYPLSMLTKEIEVGGERFVPIYRLSEFLFETEPESFNDSMGAGNWIEFMLNDNNVTNLPYKLIIKMVSWYFDVFGLIEKGLAIDKSKI